MKIYYLLFHVLFPLLLSDTGLAKEMIDERVCERDGAYCRPVYEKYCRFPFVEEGNCGFSWMVCCKRTRTITDEKSCKAAGGFCTAALFRDNLCKFPFGTTLGRCSFFKQCCQTQRKRAGGAMD